MNPQDPLNNPINPADQPSAVPTPSQPIAPQAPTFAPENPTPSPAPAALDPQQITAATPPAQPGATPPAMQSDPSQIAHPKNKLPFIVGVALVTIGLIIVIALLAL